MSEAGKIKLENCQEYDVLRFDDEVCMVTNLQDELQDFFHSYSLDLVDKLKRNLKIEYNIRNRDKNYEEWFKKGKECKIIRPGQEWKKGKIRVKLILEFIPDEPQVSNENGHQEVENITESPLDEIRQQLTEESKS